MLQIQVSNIILGLVLLMMMAIMRVMMVMIIMMVILIKIMNGCKSRSDGWDGTGGWVIPLWTVTTLKF